MMFVLLAMCTSLVLAAASALLLDWRWPFVPERKLVVIAGLLQPAAILALILYALAAPSGADRHGGGYMLLAVSGLGGGAMLISVLIGFPVSYLTLRYLRAG